MENIIAKLLNDFEAGKMNRRQLIKSLTVAASAAAAGTSVSKAAAEPSSIVKVVNVNHIGYQAPNYERCRDFYVKMCGMTVPFDTGDQCYLQFGDPNSKIGETTIHLGKSARPEGKGTITHLAYTVENWNREEIYNKLKAAGYDPEPDTEYGWSIPDSEGISLQLLAKEHSRHAVNVCGGYMQGCPKK
jgi:catechol 2,3-dioxygenase-like lactoylglutathione lyase family enzyme